MKPEIPAAASPSRAGLVAVVGRANVGKSTLLNAIFEEKVSIVSPVAQTTRNVVRAILTEPRGQLVFLDTPGVHKASYDLGRVMNRLARTAVEGVDAVLLLLDASERPREEDEGWMSRLLRDEQPPCVVVLNKSDLGGRHADAYRARWDALAKEKGSAKAVEWLRVSALSGDGIPALLERLFQLVPEGPHLFPDDILTDFPRKLAIGDVVREKFYARLRDELPHAIAVEIENVEERDGGWFARGTVLVEKPSQKAIVIGEKARLLKAVRKAAEKELAGMYGHPVALELWVKVVEKWTHNHFILKRLGYVP